MALWWIVLLFSVSIGNAQVQKCGPVNIPAPFFGDGENLSSNNCGLWNKEENGDAPWRVNFKNHRGEPTCYGILISPTLVITQDSQRDVREYEKSSNKGDWTAELGYCIHITDGYDSCLKTGDGYVAKVQSVTLLNGTENDYTLHVWKIEKVPYRKDFIWPICIFNRGNQLESKKTRQNNIHLSSWTINYQGSVEISEDFGTCLLQSEKVKTCDKVRENFLCAHFPNDVHDNNFIHEEKNRHFLRAFEVENLWKSAKFFYEIFPLLDQIVSLSDDIYLMPKVPQAKAKKDFGANQSFPGCGIVSSNRRKRDSSSLEGNRVENSKPDKQPWHARLIGGPYICGATLVSATALVTAAHCVVDEHGTTINSSQIEVTVGVHKISDQVDPKHTKKAVRVFVHEEYNPLSFDNNVAVVLVEAPGFEVSASVRPICLWNEDYDFKHIKTKAGRVVGWGFTEYNLLPNILQTANPAVLDHKECYLKNRSFFSKYLKPGHNFCAGGNGVTAYGGDSGGGFTMERGGKWFLRGVVSAGKSKPLDKGVCSANLPSLNTDVTNYMDWIVQKANL